MSNNGHYVVCPYYRDEKNLSISCDDTFRRFRYPIRKRRWMLTYCDSDWQKCPHAIRINEMYDRVLEGGADMEKEQLKLKYEEVNKAYRKLNSDYGKLTKNHERLIAEKEALAKRNRKLESHYQAALSRMGELNKKLAAYESGKKSELDDMTAQGVKFMTSMSDLVNGVLGYLTDTHGIKTISRKEVEAWRACREMKLRESGTGDDRSWEFEFEDRRTIS